MSAITKMCYLSGSYASFVLNTRRISVLEVLVLRNEGERIAPDARFGGGLRANESKGSGELMRSVLSAASMLAWLSLETRRGGGGVAYGGKVLEDGVRRMPWMDGEGSGEGTGRGLGGAIIPEAARRALGRTRGRDSKGRASNNDLKSEPLCAGVGI